MPAVVPKLVIRLGTHAEKEYLKKLISGFDGIMFAANLMEATPGATTSLLIQLSGAKAGADYYLDPMTYGFGLDLDFLRSQPKPTKAAKPKKKSKPAYKRSYVALSEALGGVFSNALKTRKPVRPEDFNVSTVDETCKRVVDYQLGRPQKEWTQDEEFASYADAIPSPAAVLAPYFFIDDADKKAWLTLVPQFAKATVKTNPGVPVHAVVCADETLLDDEASLSYLKTELPKTKADGVWLWFSNFREHSARATQLRAFRDLVESLSGSMSVHNMHGGYLSLAMSRFGLTTTAHGVGYGEQKDIAPVQGQSTPTVRYYLPDVRNRLGVPDIERTFTKKRIDSPEDFYAKVCGCTICKGVIGQGLNLFSSFGELHYATPGAKRRSQTGAAAKLCRFHFLLNRIAERDRIEKLSAAEVVAEIERGWEAWSDQPTVANNADHLPRWAEALRDSSDEGE